MVRAAFAFLALFVVGCDDVSRANSRTLDIEDPDFRQGQIDFKQGNTRKALECFLKVIDNRKGAAESNLEAGRMYLELQDPLPAIYHFNQYIRMQPASDRAPMVKQLIKTAEKQFMQQLPGGPMNDNNMGTGDVSQRSKLLQTENDKLKREITELARNQRPADSRELRSPLQGTPERIPKVADTAAPRQPRLHIVAKGDSLSTISRKYFNDTSHVSAIFAANREKMSSINTLPKIGTPLVIPE